MSFKRFVPFVCGVLSAFAVLAKAANATETFVAEQFTNVPSASVLALTEPVSSVVQEILGHPYPHDAIAYWQAEGRTVWILEGRSRSREITAGFVVRDGKLEKTQVLSHRESRGRQVRSRSFTRQFEGASLTGDRQLDRRIDAITGATISSTAVQSMARTALFLHQKASSLNPSDTTNGN